MKTKVGELTDRERMQEAFNEISIELDKRTWTIKEKIGLQTAMQILRKWMVRKNK